MTDSRPPELRSPPSRFDAPSPRPKFDTNSLKAYMGKLLPSTLQHAVWPDAAQRERTKEWIKEICGRVKERMLEIQPRGYKYIVITQIMENLGQGGRSDMMCHWQEGDVVVEETFVNDSLICMCLAFAVLE